MPSSIESQGMTLAHGDGAGTEVFTAIANIQTISGPDGTATEIDTTNLSSAAKEFRMGLKDEGSISLELKYDPDNAQHQGLLADRDSRTLRNFELNFTDTTPTKWSFAAYVTSFSINSAVDAVVDGSVTLRISGAITRA